MNDPIRLADAFKPAQPLDLRMVPCDPRDLMALPEVKELPPPEGWAAWDAATQARDAR